MQDHPSPKDRFVTVYGRKPVLEALADPALAVDKVILADNAHGPAAREIVTAAQRRGVPVRRATAQRVKVLAGNGRHDQGVLADVVAPRMRTLDAALAGEAGRPPRSVLLLDGITTPANVGMILRTATAAGVDGIVVPRRGVASIDPLVVKASAGVAFHAPVLRCGTAEEAAAALRRAGYPLFGLAADAPRTLFAADLPSRAAYVLGSETAGVSGGVRAEVTDWLAIPMSGGVESLNVASAAAVLCFDLVRRRSERRGAGDVVRPRERTRVG
ncbi:23S rRNA (guanosine2251-2'-O)-methyltransferase [Streptoalloteichus tenebrarius]|uniref:23S rRNA (Guanosine2251-2'-O)-methyltransferase n=1 Tax=Streptoalloteichus tenebrarius (strain ATCC 17920 / DSM 40477 / JCM 4838 / CBS 697.72 / NBRC 16177 / NCIMB 11028 / NRRL B-12390 / A12253. 1 / ISP 5477) TaxID=1933 RepID=A0ABT1HT42_STRSD|nr:RNA methyltransferase [Streptoalloteichus tenebrarius]MCP2258693.1 23S rRNA (guanosine2251-2'-O)-methyltransferase [Streptoalloteichus tenebrarius]BFF02839.1 RNA methyltransferase [Streptoalloteichus tenebrarius]